MSGKIRVTMRCFSQVQQALGASTLELALPAGSTGGVARAAVLERAGGSLDGLPMRLAERALPCAHSAISRIRAPAFYPWRASD